MPYYWSTAARSLPGPGGHTDSDPECWPTREYALIGPQPQTECQPAWQPEAQRSTALGRVLRGVLTLRQNSFHLKVSSCLKNVLREAGGERGRLRIRKRIGKKGRWESPYQAPVPSEAAASRLAVICIPRRIITKGGLASCQLGVQVVTRLQLCGTHRSENTLRTSKRSVYTPNAPMA